MSDDTLPWEQRGYQLSVLARELGVNFKEEFLRSYFDSHEIKELDLDNDWLVIHAEERLRGYVRDSSHADWYRISRTEPADGGIDVHITLTQ